MNKIKILHIFLIMSIVILIISCDAKKRLQSLITIDNGNGTYTNEYFNLTVILPEGWYSQPVDQFNELADVGSELLAGDDKNLKKRLEVALDKSIKVFGFYNYPPGAPVPSNPTVFCMAEYMRPYPGIKNGKDYLYHAKKLLSTAQLDYKIEDEFGIKQISGIDFHTMNTSSSVGKQTYKQTYYATLYKGYAISFIETYGNLDESKLTSQVFDSIVLDWYKKNE